MQKHRQQLRRHFRAARNNLSSAEQVQASQALAQQLLQYIAANSRIKTVAVYVSNDGEADLTPLVAALWQTNIRVALPVLHPVVKGQLLFLNYQPETTMNKNQFAIPEPKLACENILPLANIDLLCMPLVAFDAHGNRLGMGGGFYDRTLAAYQKGRYPHLQLMGIAHDCQQAEALPAAAWDIPLQHVLTPSKHWQFNLDTAFTTDSKAE
ncbi:5-formyltetrahydrofolate cyclo-ligase [Aliidiomarina iranensis]|uniref:5-formyltetrahydrofolate cyclo-ligase n=2 Tax=Aliidiomarina iranensis TaxID=1434071 RepID=A0A432VVD0_9GAMM|nr:5-formyltetrahydrofolate cyclo-ligase [Aliidiomarina iranensis]